jgi:hypothetical protein
MLYVRTIATIKITQVIIVMEVSEHVYIYLSPLGHTHKGLASIEYEFCELIREKGHSKGVQQNHGWFLNGPKPYITYRDFYFRAPGSLVVLSFPQPLNFSSVFPSL